MSQANELVFFPKELKRGFFFFLIEQLKRGFVGFAGVTHVGGDMFKSIPGADAIFMKVFYQYCW